jgi:hypothetical protein
MPNQVPPWLEERVIAFALGHPGLGPRRIAAQLRQPMWDGLVLTVVDASNVTNNAATALTTEMGSVSLNDSAGASLWPGASPGPAGSDTYTFTVTKGPNFNTDASDAGQSCGFSILFTQVAD